MKFAFGAFGGDFYGSLGIPHWVPCSKSRGPPPDRIRLPSCAVCGQCFESLRVNPLLASPPLVVGAVFPSLVIYRQNLAVRAATYTRDRPLNQNRRPRGSTRHPCYMRSRGPSPPGMGDRKAVAVYLCFRTLNAKKDTHASHFFPLHVASGQCAACLIMKMRSNEGVELERLERLAHCVVHDQLDFL